VCVGVCRLFSFFFSCSPSSSSRNGAVGVGVGVGFPLGGSRHAKKPPSPLPLARLVDITSSDLRVDDAGHEAAEADKRDGFGDPAVESGVHVRLAVSFEHRGRDRDDGYSSV
jgi:hypothetical protein